MTQIAQDISARRFSPQLTRGVYDDDQLRMELLAITVAGLAKTKPLRRSQLARRDYVPEPVCSSTIRRPRLRSLARSLVSVARWASLLVALVIIVAAMWTGIGWINAHSSGGSMLEPETIQEVQERAFFQLPALPPPWHWAMLPGSFATDEEGRPSFFIRARDRGTVKSESDLPKTAEIGDQYTLADGTMSWIWMIPISAKGASWIDPR
jgi:hypothetical protein